MKKFFLSTFVFLASAGYIAYQYLGGGSAAAAQSPIATVAQTTQTATPSGQSGAIQVVTTTPAPSATVASSQTQSSGTATTPATTPAPATTPVATPAPVPVTKQTGQYKDGTYTGSSADAYYGTVQVQAVVQGGKLVTVNFLQYPSDRNTSRYINSQAMPMLQTEAIQAQSANVSGVSGATDTSAAFVQSLGSALAQANNS